MVKFCQEMLNYIHYYANTYLKGNSLPFFTLSFLTKRQEKCNFLNEGNKDAICSIKDQAESNTLLKLSVENSDNVKYR